MNASSCWFAAVGFVAFAGGCSLLTGMPPENSPVSLWLTALHSEDINIRMDAAYSFDDISPNDKTAVSALVSELEDDDPFVRRHVASALGEMAVASEEAIPALIQALGDEKEDVREHATIALIKIGSLAIPSLIDALRFFESQKLADERSQWPPIASYIELALTKIGPLAVPDLLNAFGKDPDSDEQFRCSRICARDSAIYILSKIGKAAVPHLIVALKNNDPVVRLFAVQALAGMGSDAETTVPHLILALHDNDPEVRLFAVQALGRIGAGTETAVPIVSEFLKNSAGELQKRAANALITMGPQGIATLCAALKDQNEQVRVLASAVLSNSRSRLPQDAAILPALIGALTDTNTQVRANVTYLLEELVPPITILLERQKDSDLSIREQAQDVLRRMSVETNSKDLNMEILMSFLSEILSDPNKDIRSQAANALIGFENIDKSTAKDVAAVFADVLLTSNYVYAEDRMNAASKLLKNPTVARTIIPVLSRALINDERYAFREAVAHTLAMTGSEGVAVLLSLLTSDDEGIRIAVAFALGDSQLYDEKVLLALVNALTEQNEYIRPKAMDLLVKIGSKAPILSSAVTDKLLTFAEAKDEQTRKSVIKILGVLNGTDGKVIAVLARALHDPKSEIRLLAAKAILEIKPPKAVIPELVNALVQLLNDPSKYIREHAASYLGQIGTDAKDAESALIKALRDQSLRVRYAAAEALIAIGTNPEKVGPALITVINDTYSSALIKLALKDFAQAKSLGVGDSELSLPAFPWPPPRFSAHNIIPSKLLGKDNSTLKSVYERLSAALETTGFEENGLFEVPGGFALVTKVERIHEDGTSAIEDRWLSTTLQPTDLISYLGQLFLERPGQFRLIVFVITTQDNFQSSGESLSEEAALNLFLEGGRILPETIGKLPFAGHHCHTLIYHFEKKRAKSIELIPSPLTANEHLRRAGVMEILSGT